MEDLDLESFANLGLVDPGTEEEDVDENDPELLAALAELSQEGEAAPPPPPLAPARAVAVLREEAAARKAEALRLKKAGDARGAVASLRRAKALEVEAAAAVAAAPPEESAAAAAEEETPAMEAVAEAVLPSLAAAVDGGGLRQSAGGVGAPLAPLVAETALVAEAEETAAADGPEPETLAGRAIALKRRALFLKRSGDVRAAVACLRRAKALEAGEGPAARAIARAVGAARAPGARRAAAWASLRAALADALAAAVAEAKAALDAGDRAGAGATAARCREIRADAARCSRLERFGDPPAFLTIATERLVRRVDARVPPAALRVEVTRVALPPSARAGAGAPAPGVARVAWAFTGACGDAAGGVPLAALARAGGGAYEAAWAARECAVEADLGHDTAAAAAAARAGRASRRELSALARFGRGKLTLSVYAAPGGRFFGRREALIARRRVCLEPLLAEASLDGTSPAAGRVRLRVKSDHWLWGPRRILISSRSAVASNSFPAVSSDRTVLGFPVALRRLALRTPQRSSRNTHVEPYPEYGWDSTQVRLEDGAPDAFARHGAAVDFTLSLREPLRDPIVAASPGRRDVAIDASTWPVAPVGTPAAAAARAPPPAAEVADPHGAAYLVSDAVLDAALARHDRAGSTALDVVATRLALATAQQLLHAAVAAGDLTVRAYAARVADRRDADRALARHLAGLGQKSDASRVLERCAIADAELAEMAAADLAGGA